MSVGLVPDGLTNIGLVVAWTPGEAKYALTLITHEGRILHDYHATAKEPIGYDPKDNELDMLVYWGLESVGSLASRFARSLAGFAYFKWWAPVDMPSKDRAMYGGIEK